MNQKGSVLTSVSIVMLFLVISERSVEAYIDPGSASYIFQIIAGVLLGGVFLVRTCWNRVVTTVRGWVSRDVARNP